MANDNENKVQVPKKDGKTDVYFTTFVAILAIAALGTSIFIGRSFYNLRDDYQQLKTDYANQSALIASIARKNIELSEHLVSGQTPKIKVVNFLETAAKLPGANVDTQEGLEQAFLQMQRVARAYAEEGYLLIDSEAIVATPTAMQLNLQELSGQ
ncbi:hypothetical protein [Thalassospira sp. CH_XMU1420-2]|uniref:hypothetical protein n=1 Tax=Thalassospira sp. CH_XMU1420-2 TaxID=3107769 RepID=UPI003009047F|tara:strand:- start:16936 stop:17400 length:465 start_codon:yes stop_codon:yes gene_type:complete